MTPETWAEIRAEWKAALPRVLDGDEEGQSLICFNQNGREILWESGANMGGKRSVSDILSAVSQTSGISTSAIKGKSKKPQIVKARRVAAYLIKQEHPNLTYKAISRILGSERTAIKRGIEIIEYNTDTWTAWVLRGSI